MKMVRSVIARRSQADGCFAYPQCAEARDLTPIIFDEEVFRPERAERIAELQMPTAKRRILWAFCNLHSAIGS
jgi:hypothetical protein